MRFCGFEPYVNADSTILILGSFPSIKSREENFFYGNPLNRFWRVLAESCNQQTPTTVEEKKAFLKRNKIALWDVVTECEIEGSLDSNIRDFKVADVAKLVQHTRIKRILLNGGMAAKIFLKNFPQFADIAVTLPSTSPANVRFNKDIWLKELAVK